MGQTGSGMGVQAGSGRGGGRRVRGVGVQAGSVGGQAGSGSGRGADKGEEETSHFSPL